MTQAAEKQTVWTVETPSGIEVLYQAEPKRLYRVRHTKPQMGAGKAGDYDWREVPSVTTVLGVLDKPALPWWGMKVGVEGVISLFNMGILHRATAQSGQQVLATNTEDGMFAAGTDEVISLLTRHALTVNHVRDKAGDRGTSVHSALELWADDGKLPDPDIFPPGEQGYVQGLRAFLEHADPEPVASEVMVGSLEHGFAGRYDIRFKLKEERQVVFHRTPVKGAQWATVKPGIYLGDLKTSSGVYPSHSLQLEGYEGASIEDGYDATEARGIIHVNADGTYEFVRSRASYEDFLNVVAVWRTLEDMKGRK